jgi:recombination protein RecT
VTDLSAKIATKQVERKSNPTVKDLVEAQRPAIERQLAGAMNSDAFVRTVLNEISKTPKLAAADPATLLGGVMLAAQLRLEIGSGMGEFYLTPRQDRGRDICLPIIGFQGYIKLAMRSGLVTNVEAFMVREGDLFSYGATSERGRFYDWTPQDFDEKRPWTHVVASARMKGGGTSFVILPRDLVLKRRPSYWESTPWKTEEEPMALKTGVRALMKFLPKSTDMGRAMEADEAKVQHIRGLEEVQVTRLDDTVDAEVVELDPAHQDFVAAEGDR